MSDGTSAVEEGSDAPSPGEPESTAPATRQPSSLPLAAVVFVLVLIVAGGVWSYVRTAGTKAEAQARETILRMGAIASPNAKGKPITSVKLTLPQAHGNLDAIVEALPDLGSLSSLDTRGAPITDAHMARIGDVRSLSSLVLTETHVTDQGLAELTALSNLEALYLANTAVTNKGLAKIAAMDSLTILDISGTQISGDLAPIANLSNLDWLVVNRLKLSDDVSDVLLRLKALMRLTMLDAEVSDKVVESLREQRSDLTIDL